MNPVTTTIISNEVNQLPIFAFLGEDSPRARRSDPMTSHMAADKSASGLSEMKQRILDLFSQLGGMTDSELNKVYLANAEIRGWAPVRHDTPRKRRSDLSSAGLLVSTGETRVNGFGSPEQVWQVAS
jgi:hypothetical protein